MLLCEIEEVLFEFIIKIILVYPECDIDRKKDTYNHCDMDFPNESIQFNTVQDTLFKATT